MIKIRKTRFWEYKKISNLYSEIFSKEYKENWTPKIALKKMKIFSKFCEIYSVFYNKILVGVLIINPVQFVPGTVIFLEEMAVKKEFRNKGVGSYCLNWVEEKYAKKGFKLLMFLSLKDSKAFRFYKNKRYKLSKNQFIYEKELK